MKAKFALGKLSRKMKWTFRLLFAFLRLMEKQKEYFLLSKGRGEENEVFMILTVKILLSRVFPQNLKKDFHEKHFKEFFNLAQKHVQKERKTTGGVPQWKRFSFYHLILDSARVQVESKGENSIQLKIGMWGNKMTMFPRVAILDSRNCRQPVFFSFSLNNYTEFII